MAHLTQRANARESRQDPHRRNRLLPPPPQQPRTVCVLPNARPFVSDGAYLEAKEQGGGFWILEVADLEEAVAWARTAVVACRPPVEVRPFFESPPSIGAAIARKELPPMEPG